MNRGEYINCLADKLKRLPKEDYEKAMEYFVEYFEEAGGENEQQAIEDLGSPAMAADQIIMNMAIKNAEEPNKGVKKGLSAVWIGILAVFAAPIALPIALAMAAVLFTVVLTIFVVLISIIVTGVSFILVSILGIVGGVCLIFISPVNGIATLGVALACVGISILVCNGCIFLGKLLINCLIKLFGKLAMKGRKHEK